MELTKPNIKRPYEVVVLVHPDTTLDEQKELFRKNKSIIETSKGSVHSLETWGKRNLATQIGKHKRAIFFHSMFEAGPDAIAELERTMRINDKVIRFLHSRLDERLSISKHLEMFKRGLKESADKEKEREAKALARKAAFAAGGDRDRGDRGDRGDRNDRGPRRRRDEREEREEEIEDEE